MSKGPEHLGAKLGPRIARLTADAVHHAQVKAGPHKIRLGMQLQEQFFRLTGSEIQATLGPLFRQIAEHDETPEHLRNTFAFLADGLGQWQTFLASNLGGSVLSTGISALLTNELAPPVGRIIQENPNGMVPIGTVISMYARGLLEEGFALTEAARQGISQGRFYRMVRGAQSGPGVSDTLTLLRRGKLDAAGASRALTQAGIADEWTDATVSLMRETLSPSLLADAVVKGLIGQDQAAEQAWHAGIDTADFDLMVRDTGEAPALQTLLEGYRRGLINDARLEHGIRTGRLRNEWIDLAKALRYVPPSPAEAITGAVQGHLSVEAAKSKAQQAGLNPAEFDWLFQTHGEPISVGEALQLWRRGVMGQSEVEQVIRESRTKTKYIPAVLALRRHLLPERTIVAAYGKGALDVAAATRHLADLGVAEEDIRWLLAEASATKTAHHRQLSEAHLLELYEAGAIDAAHATTALEALGYDAHEAAEVLALADMRAERRQQLAVVNVIRSRYVARHITRPTASAELDALGLAHTERDQLLPLWDLERETTVRLPTVAELTHAVKAQVIDADTWAGRLVEMGYSADDVPIIAAAHGVAL